ncbi:DUF2812 domain-containing protein [Psychrobacillus sp. FSL H8-0483]|uniref:DUF2812 domain-containing protein n=1 Tax=Psychrobacillus sp. FSL H8-0483 TaxID=2921389 RepID=UPI00315AF1AA
MEKVILKLKPSNYWRIGEHESWFSDMASEGLHLRKLGWLFVHFLKEEPRKTRYRIDALQNKTITSEQQELYADSGWSYVTSYGMFSVFSSPVELNAPELHTDPEEQSYTLKALDKKVASSALLVAIITLLFIGLIYFALFANSTPTLALIEGKTIPPMTLFIIIYSAYYAIQATIAVRSLRKKLKEGKPINHYAPWRKMRNVDLMISNVLIVFALVIAILPFVQIAKVGIKEMPIENTDLPIIRLADVEQNAEMVRYKTHMQDPIDRANRYLREWSILAPIQYEADERGLISGQEWRDGSGLYSPSIHNRVYKLTFSTMSEDLIDDLIKRYSSWDKEKEYVQMEHSSFDLLIVHEGEEIKEVFAAKGKGVIYVRYYGYADIDGLITNTAQQISLIAD